ncbi:MAG TPA: cation:proton antiporter [Sphingomicrobium sp.]|nr:cation:proton antiporter [Sphingomicrobium sp.]
MTITPALSDALTILGAAGIVIPAFARFRVSPVIGFILVGIIAGPFGLGALVRQYPWLEALSITDPAGIEPFAELGIVLLLFSIGLQLSFRRLVAMRKMVFGIGAAEMLLIAALIGGGLIAFGWPVQPALWLSLALAMSSTALVLPISGTQSPVGRAALSMLLFEDLALVPMLLLIGAASGAAASSLGTVAIQGTLVIAAMLLVGRFALPALFAQAARTKNPELFLAISLLVVILSATATAAVGLSPILGALIAGLIIAETDYRQEVETVTAPFRGLALGVFLITVGMRIDLGALLAEWPALLGALLAVILVKAAVTGLLLRLAGVRQSVAAETGLLMASPSETTLIVLGAAGVAGILSPDSVAFWSAATAIGLTITPLLASLGRITARRVDRDSISALPDEVAGRTMIFGFGRVGRMIADMLTEHRRPYLAVDSDIDSFIEARKSGYSVIFGDVARREFATHLNLATAAAVVLTMDDPVLTARLTKRLRADFPDLPLIARARDTDHAAALYRAGVTDAVPEALEASLQLSEAVLVDIGVAMGPVIASIHEKRAQLRSEIMAASDLASEPSLGRRRARDSLPGTSAAPSS